MNYAVVPREERCDQAMRTHPCVRLFCIIDTLTSASVLPGIDVIIEELPKRVVGADHGCIGNMSRPYSSSINRRA